MMFRLMLLIGLRRSRRPTLKVIPVVNAAIAIGARLLPKLVDIGYTSNGADEDSTFQPETGPGSPGFQHPAYQGYQTPPAYGGAGQP